MIKRIIHFDSALKPSFPELRHCICHSIEKLFINSFPNWIRFPNMFFYSLISLLFLYVGLWFLVFYPFPFLLVTLCQIVLFFPHSILFSLLFFSYIKTNKSRISFNLKLEVQETLLYPTMKKVNLKVLPPLFSRLMLLLTRQLRSIMELQLMVVHLN